MPSPNWKTFQFKLVRLLQSLCSDVETLPKGKCFCTNTIVALAQVEDPHLLLPVSIIPTCTQVSDAADSAPRIQRGSIIYALASGGEIDFKKKKEKVVAYMCLHINSGLPVGLLLTGVLTTTSSSSLNLSVCGLAQLPEQITPLSYLSSCCQSRHQRLL